VLAEQLRLTILTGICLALCVSACSKTKPRDYGTLGCLDGWPAQPTDGPAASLSVAPSIVWQFDQGAASPLQQGVALSGDTLVVSGGASWAALDRANGTVRVRQSATPGNLFLSAPVLDGAGRIYVQSRATLHAFNSDGSTRWTSSLGASPATSEPESASFMPTLIDDRTLLVRGSNADIALTTDGAKVWNAPGGVSLYAVGHWGLGSDNKASFVTDLRTATPAGRLTDAKGRDVAFVTVLGGRGIVAAVREAAGYRFLLLDTCGRETWSTAVFEGSEIAAGHGLVGPGEITYAQIIHTDSAGNETRSPDIVAIDPAGQVVAGPIARKETPWLVGADGTVYVVEFQPSALSSRMAALSPLLQERWTLDVPAEFAYYTAAALADDGVLYAQGSSKTVAIQTASPGLAHSSWPSPRHDNHATNWGGGQF
jgi:hypothetical protein